MELFFAQNHAPMTHLPIATSILAAVAAMAAVVFPNKKEITWAWAILAIIALVTCIPAVFTGLFAAVGRFYIESPGLIPDTPENDPIALHQRLGIIGFVLALILAYLGIRQLRGKASNRYVMLFLSVALAIVWGYGGHLGGKGLWSPETFPAYEHLLEDTAD